MATLLKRIVLSLLAGACLSSVALGAITKNADKESYDFFYYQEPLLDLVNDVRRLSSKNILFKPADLKGVSISYGREQVELMTSFTEVLGIYGFGFKRMADNIFMIERVRSIEEVEAALLRNQNALGGENGSSSAELLAEASKVVATNSTPGTLDSETPSSKATVVHSSPKAPGVQGKTTPVKNQTVNRWESPDFVKAVAGFQRRYTEALIAEGFTKEEAMKMAMGFNPVSLVPSTETPPTP